MRKLKVAVLTIVFILSTLSFPEQKVSAATMTVSFPERLGSSAQSKTVTLPAGATITSVTADNGTASYTKSGNNVTVTVAGGSPTRTVTPSKSVNSNSDQYLNSTFPSTKSYNDGTYSGTLYKSGSSYVVSGSQTSAQTKYYSDTKDWIETDYCTWNRYIYTMVYQYSTGSAPSSTKYDNGVAISLSPSSTWQLGVSYTQYATPNMPRGTDGYPDQSWIGSGNVSNGSTYVTAYHYMRTSYSGSHYFPASDTRTWRQAYSGTVYAATQRYYAYNVTINYTTDTTPPTEPTINITSPAGYVSGTWTNQNVKFTITAGTDSGSGVQKTEYSTDGGTTWTIYTLSTQPNPLIEKTISTEGTTVVKARTVDNAGNVSTIDTVTIKIDKTGPTLAISAPSVSTTDFGPVTYTVTYSGADTITLASTNITLNKTGTGNGTITVANGSNSVTKIVTVSNITGGGTLKIVIAAGTASDLAGNMAPSAASTAFTIDVPVAIDTISVLGPRTYGDAATLNATGTNIGSAAYRIYYVTSDTAPRVNTAADAFSPGTGWQDGMDGLVGVSITPTSPSSLSASVPGTSLAKTNQDPVTHKQWTYVIFKIWAQSTSGNTTQRFSQAYSIDEVLNLDPDNYIGTVDFKQISGSSWTSSPINTFTNGDNVTYRLEFEAVNPDKINGMKMNVDFNSLKQDGIELQIQSALLQKEGTGNSFQNITPNPTVIFSKNSKNRYAIEFGQDAVNAIKTGAANKKYAVQFTAKVHTSGTGTVTITNQSRLKILTDMASYMFMISPDRPGRDFYIDSKVQR